MAFYGRLKADGSGDYEYLDHTGRMATLARVCGGAPGGASFAAGSAWTKRAGKYCRSPDLELRGYEQGLKSNDHVAGERWGSAAMAASWASARSSPKHARPAGADAFAWCAAQCSCLL